MGKKGVCVCGGLDASSVSGLEIKLLQGHQSVRECGHAGKVEVTLPRMRCHVTCHVSYITYHIISYTMSCYIMFYTFLTRH